MRTTQKLKIILNTKQPDVECSCERILGWVFK